MGTQRLIAAIVALGMVSIVFLTALAQAKNPDGSITLTPSVLYDLIVVEQKKSAHQTAILELLRGRLKEMDERIDALEVKVQKTRDSAAHCLRMLDAKKVNKPTVRDITDLKSSEVLLYTDTKAVVK